MKNQLLTIAACVVIFLLANINRADAQLPYAGSFKTSSQKGLVVSGIAKLTAASGLDPEGQGYLQLTDTGLNRVGYMYAEDSFPSNYGLTATFEFFIYKTGANSFNQADGICFFLFDASVATFRPGAFGGSLGYAQKNSIPGMSRGYIGIGIDEFGNFSNPADGLKNGGPGQFRGSVTVRGPGNGLSATDYVYQKHVVTNTAPYNINFQGFNQRYPDSTSANYRRVKFIMTPGSTLGANAGYTVKVIMYRGGTTVTPVDIIDNLDYPFIAPAQLQYGMAASTGSNVDFHEIRNMDIRATNTNALQAPIANADNITTCTGQPAIFDITSNDASQNAGGSINRETIDLDPVTAGIQTSFIDAGKGSYSIDANKNIMFMPANGFSGTSTISYTVKDSYGLTSPNGSINVSLSATQAPGLTISNPASVCAPAVIDITNVAYRTETTSGATFDYFATLNNAYNNIGSLGNAAKTISTSGVYYIKTSANGCSTVKPISVAINQTPSTAAAGPDQIVCSATGSTASISTAGTIPDVGNGTWTQVSGPALTTIVNPNSAITAINGLNKGTYVYRWTVANGACASTIDDVQIFSNVAPLSNAGPNQNLANATTATLAANTPNVGTGVWTRISGPAVNFTTSTSPTTAVTGLTIGSTYVLAWTVSSAGCSAASSQVTITNTSVVMADAGLDQSLTAVQNISLSGNEPINGQTGLWTVVSSPAGSTPVFANASNRFTSVSGINRLGEYTFKWTITNGQASTEDLVKITVLSVLPIDLTSFTVKMQDGAAMLNWKTPLTTTNKRFTVQRSTDGNNFQNLAEVNESKNIAGSIEYGYADKLNGSEGNRLYYRLRQVNQAGIVDYSEILVLKMEGLMSAQFWPNPFSARVSMKLNFMKAGTAQVRLLDTNGKLIRDYQEKVTAGNNFLNIDGLNSLAPGVYQVLISKDGITTTNKVVKQ